MNHRGSLTSLLAVVALVAAGVLQAQPRQRPPTSYAQIGLPDQAEGRKILEESRNIGLAGPYYLEFELRVLPRAGSERKLPGRWFGSRNASGPVTRIEVTPPGQPTEVWLVQSGFQPAVWRGTAEADFSAVELAAQQSALSGSNISAIDVQTPFMFWSDFVYEGLARFRGRPTHVFLLFPPEVQQERFPGYGGARVFIDTAWGALSQAQWVDPSGKALKTITLLELKRIGERWIVKSFEVRDDTTRDKTRLVVRAAALDLPLPGEIFTPAGSASPASYQVPAKSLTLVR
jgi:hypothetical protein